MKSMKLALVFVTGFASVCAMETDGVEFDNEKHVSFYSESFAELENIGTEDFKGFGEIITVSVRSTEEEGGSKEEYQATRSTKWAVLSIKENDESHRLFPYEFELNGNTHVIYLSTQSEEGYFFAYVLNRHEVCCKLTHEAFIAMMSAEVAIADVTSSSDSKRGGCFIL